LKLTLVLDGAALHHPTLRGSSVVIIEGITGHMRGLITSMLRSLFASYWFGDLMFKGFNTSWQKLVLRPW
jgi:hypothetical protein